MRRILAIFTALLLLGTAVACDDEADEAESTEEETEATDDDGDDESASDSDDDGHTEGDHEMVDDLEPGESDHYGEAFTIDNDAESLSDVIARLEDSDDEGIDEVKVAAKVKHVCEKRGCWMALDDDTVDIPVRVHMYDYSFFVPRNVAGADAIAQGSLKHTVISEDDARHYAEHVVDQTGVDPDDIEGEQEMYEFTATGITLELSES